MNKTEMLTTQLSEECNEIGQMCSKINRFGWDQVYSKLTETNGERLVEELNDMMGVISVLVDEGLIPEDWLDQSKVKRKKEKVLHYLDFSKELGTLA